MASSRLHPTWTIFNKITCTRLLIDQTIFTTTSRKVCNDKRSYFIACSGRYHLHDRIWNTHCQIFSVFDISATISKTLQSCRFYSDYQNYEPKPFPDSKNSSVESLVDTLVGKASERDKMVISISKSVLSEQVRELMNAGMDDEDVVRLCSPPAVLKNLSNFVKLIEVTYQHGFTNKDISCLVKKYPEIAEVGKSQFEKVFNDLHNIGFSYDGIKSMIIQSPALLDCDILSKIPMIEELKSYFKRADTFKLIQGSPDVLFSNMTDVLEKFHYVFHHMGISQPQMMHSNWLTYSMEHIRARHMFLVRTGYFKKVNRAKGQIDLNPKLNTILDSSDEEFARKFGNMTGLDYQTFKSLLSEEDLYLEEEEHDE